MIEYEWHYYLIKELVKYIPLFFSLLFGLVVILIIKNINPIIKLKTHQSDIKTFGLLDLLFKPGINLETRLYLKLVELEGKTLVNVLIPYEDGTTEVDLIHISPNGVFVIEAKNIRGKVYGASNKKQWTTYYNPNSKFTFLNPIWQNKKHVNAVKQL